MSIYAVQIDSENAKVFDFKDGEVTHHTYRSHEPDHHSGHAKDQDKKSEHFFQQVAGHLTGAKHLLLMGAGLGKDHFKSHLDKHHQHDLASVVTAVETVDHPTDGQLVAHAREVFSKHNITV